MVFRFANLNFFNRWSRWKVALESWAMIAFITWVLGFTGALASPLVNAYLLPVITAALTLGTLTTLAEVGLIAACYLYLGSGVSTDRLLSLAFYAEFAAQLAPIPLVAYIVSLFSANIRYGLDRAKLLAETDGLTGLLNLRGFAIAADPLFAQALRYNRESAILMIDSDNLKPVNDSHGHEAGNRLIKQLAKTIRAELRNSDVPARYGGDEFIVFLSETPLKGALIVAERIRDAMAAMPLAIDGKQVGCTVSIGVACFPEDGLTIDAIASRADRAMYQAKQAGRNRVVRFPTASNPRHEPVGT
jgi:diguanylate cyclase (GGDEF)-like protein